MLKKKWADFLPGGKLNKPTPQQKQTLRATRAENDGGERCLSNNDRFTRLATTMTQEKKSAKCKMKLNRTDAWMDGLSNADEIAEHARAYCSEKGERKKIFDAKKREDKAVKRKHTLAKVAKGREKKRKKQEKKDHLQTVHRWTPGGLKLKVGQMPNGTGKERTARLAFLKEQIQAIKDAFSDIPDIQTLLKVGCYKRAGNTEDGLISLISKAREIEASNEACQGVDNPAL